jgi:ribosomal protein S18 acetylase RimI-like enzyme
METKLRTLVRLANSMMYVNDTIVLLRHEIQTDPISPARILYANEENFSDIVAFHPRQYADHFAKLYGLGHFRNVFREDDIKDSWSRGDTVCLGYLDGDCVHRSWVILGPRTVFLQFPFLRMKLGAKDAYVEYTETAPEARGRNITAHVFSKVSKDLEEKGFRVYVAVQERNVPMIRSATKAGFMKTKRVRLFGLLGIGVKKVMK